ncbi:hypothetical protein [Synechocystis sp. LKSZ1]|uniref:hypothetical protein n=1 Tax=Synechocystis sp. LKSZ1 TaxID=3144951 RepID=UPI00336BCAC9
MSSNSPHDRPLVHFLQRHRPLPPPALPALEDELIACLPRQALASQKAPRRLLAWGLPLAAVASVMAGAIVLPSSWRTAQQTATPTELEAFLLESWSVTADSNTDEPALLSAGYD